MNSSHRLLLISFLTCLLGGVVSLFSACGRFESTNSTTQFSQQSQESQKATIVLPLEVLGHRGARVSVDFDLSETQLERASDRNVAVEAEIFGLDYDDKGAVELNGVPFRLRNDSVEFLQSWKKDWGGFGGGFSTFKLRIPLLARQLKAGKNRLTFVFDRQNGVSIGYRVLSFNLSIDGARVFADADFIPFDFDSMDAQVLPPEKVARGKDLWQTAQLVRSSTDSTPIRARCLDCHATSGFDLKYFSYTDFAIVERAKFHGLSEADGGAIAAYIRSLKTKGYGRPWNPPYQPGPGLLSQPVAAWAAGAGQEWVVSHEETLRRMFPAGIPAKYDMSSRYEINEVPVPMELPVWNHWLPHVAPMEDEFLGEAFNQENVVRELYKFTGYPDFRTLPPTREAWISYRTFYHERFSDFTSMFTNRGIPSAPADVPGDPDAHRRSNDRYYSLALWRNLKSWEILVANRLDGLGKVLQQNPPPYTYFPDPQTPERLLHTGHPFAAAPHMVKMSYANNGLRGNGDRRNWDYFSSAWYYLQVLVNDNSRTGDGFSHWPYTVAFGSVRAGASDFAPIRAILNLKVLEAHTLLGFGPQSVEATSGNYKLLHYFGSLSLMTGRYVSMPATQRVAHLEAMIRSYMEEQQKVTVDQFKAIHPDQFAGACAQTLGPHPDSLCRSTMLYWMPGNLHESGVSLAVLDTVVDEGERLWPQFDWQCLRDFRTLGEQRGKCPDRNRARGIQVP